ncbi:MAG: hypothetical protein RIQ60_2971 [Pseudomonadota bacterium]|jgi:AcrR family transcriptional regulator
MTLQPAPRDERRKPPRRTAERILAVALDLFNRRGEPQVSTTLISAELKISPGNLYYHYPAKEALVNALVERYEAALHRLLDEQDPPAPGWTLLPALLALGWRYRFLFRDLNDLLARNRQLETRCQSALQRQHATLQGLARGLQGGRGQALDDADAQALATNLLLLLSYWFCHEYVRDPRHALEPDHEAAVLARGTAQLRALLQPYLDAAALAALDEPVPPFGADFAPHSASLPLLDEDGR